VNQAFKEEWCYRGKVATLATVLITNNLSGYTTGYKFFKVATSLIANDLSGYTQAPEKPSIRRLR
jgi:hypothetical protein